jgi:phage-related protein
MDTFTPPVPPDNSAQMNWAPSILEAQFGDGYAARAGDGINNVRGTYQPKWSNLHKSEADSIVAFFKSQGGYKTFTYTRPGQTDAEYWVCKRWTDAIKSGDYYDLSAEFSPGNVQA